MTSLWTFSLPSFTWPMKSRMPPSNRKSAFSPPARSSLSSMRRPRVRNAISRIRWESGAHAAGDERHLAHPLGERLERVVGLVEDVAVRQEGDGGARLGARLALDERSGGVAALVALAPDVAVAADLDLQRLRERVHDRDADAVQTTRHLVTPAPELAAGVELREDDLDGRQADALHHRHGDAAAVVGHGHASVRMDGDGGVVAAHP